MQMMMTNDSSRQYGAGGNLNLFFKIRLALDIMWHVCTFIFHFQQFFSFFFLWGRRERLKVL